MCKISKKSDFSRASLSSNRLLRVIKRKSGKCCAFIFFLPSSINRTILKRSGILWKEAVLRGEVNAFTFQRGQMGSSFRPRCVLMETVGSFDHKAWFCVSPLPFFDARRLKSELIARYPISVGSNQQLCSGHGKYFSPTGLRIPFICWTTASTSTLNHTEVLLFDPRRHTAQQVRLLALCFVKLLDSNGDFPNIQCGFALVVTYFGFGFTPGERLTGSAAPLILKEHQHLKIFSLKEQQRTVLQAFLEISLALTRVQLGTTWGDDTRLKGYPSLVREATALVREPVHPITSQNFFLNVHVTSWICELNATELGNIPSGLSGYSTTTTYNQKVKLESFSCILFFWFFCVQVSQKSINK